MLPIKGHGEDGIRVTVDDVDSNSPGNVPDDNHVIIASTHKNIFSRRMPLNNPHPSPVNQSVTPEYSTHSLPVTRELYHTVPQVTTEATIRNVPHTYVTVFTTTRYYVVIEWIPLDIQHWAGVSCHLPRMVIYSPTLLYQSLGTY